MFPFSSLLPFVFIISLVRFSTSSHTLFILTPLYFILPFVSSHSIFFFHLSGILSDLPLSLFLTPAFNLISCFTCLSFVTLSSLCLEYFEGEDFQHCRVCTAISSLKWTKWKVHFTASVA